MSVRKIIQETREQGLTNGGRFLADEIRAILLFTADCKVATPVVAQSESEKVRGKEVSMLRAYARSEKPETFYLTTNAVSIATNAANAFAAMKHARKDTAARNAAIIAALRYHRIHQKYARRAEFAATYRKVYDRTFLPAEQEEWFDRLRARMNGAIANNDTRADLPLETMLEMA